MIKPYNGITISMNSMLGNHMLVARPDLILAGAEQYAMLQAYVDFQGRDRRRIKREVNKAAKQARRQSRMGNH